MHELSERDAIAFFRRSYTAVDGLWFMKVEERLGFEAALEIDAAVWQVVPKIQARALQAMTGQQRGLDALCACLTAKLDWESYRYETVWREDHSALCIVIHECPWRDLLRKSGREHLAAAVGQRICNTEYAVWAREFGEALHFELGRCLCCGEGVCELWFRHGKVYVISIY
ncbi:MAG: hypothetical protein FJZ90_13730 [Chloroflexi bacterium]|nr:hypothetical protein [Chloroflexota bacterium]